MAIQDLMTSNQDSYWAGMDTHSGAALPSTWTFGRTANLNQPDSAGNYLTPNDLPTPPAGFSWKPLGMGGFALLSNAAIADPTNPINVMPSATQTRAQMEAQSREMDRARAAAQERAAAIPTDAQRNAMNEAAQRAIDAGGINPYDPYEVARKRVWDLQKQGITSGPAYDEATSQMRYYSPTSKGSMGGDTGFTGAGIQAGQSAMGAAADRASSGAAQMGAAADAAALGAQPGYGAGETARALARQLAEAATPAATTPISDAQLQAMAGISPAMQGTEDSAGLPTGPLTEPKPSVGSALYDAAKAIPGIGGAIEAGEKGISAGKGLISAFGQLGGSLGSTPSTPSSPTVTTPMSAFGTPYSTPSQPMTRTTPPGTTPASPTSSFAPPQQKFSPKGKVDYSAQNKLEESLKKAKMQNLPRNLEFGFRMDTKPKTFFGSFK